MVYYYYAVIDTWSHCKRFELGDHLFVCHAGVLAGLRYDIVLKFHCSNCVLGGKSIKLLVHVVCVCPGRKFNPYLNVVTRCNGILPANGALACVYVCTVSLCVRVCLVWCGVWGGGCT